MTRLTLLGAAALVALPAAAQTPDSTAMTPGTALVADSALAVSTLDRARASTLNREALAAEGTRDYAAALAVYDRALAADSTYAPALLGRGNMLSQLGRNPEARLSYDAAIAAAAGQPAFARVLATATDNSRIVTGLLAEEAAIARQQADVDAQTAAVAVQTVAIEAATALLTPDPLTPENAQAGFDQLEAARAAGYDPNSVAFYYAKALNALQRGAEALPYAEQALAASTEADKSVYHIQVGIANRFAGNDPAAREAFTAAKGGSWAGWADHYLGEMGPAPTATP